MRVIDLIKTASEHLKDKGFPNSRLEVERMLSSTLNLSRMNLYMNFDKPLGESELEKFRSLYRRRLKNEPIQYIIGTGGFRELEVKTDKRALIPRPETEQLVQQAIEYLRDIKNPYVADLGTGTGVIALSIAYEIPDSKVIAIDISSEALELARYNALTVGLDKSVEFIHGDMISEISGLGKFDAVISNPPYVKSKEIKGLDPEVRDYEPLNALDGGIDGLDFLLKITGNIHDNLKSGALLALECDDSQTEIVKESLVKTDFYKEIEIIRDFAGKRRIVRSLRK